MQTFYGYCVWRGSRIIMCMIPAKMENFSRLRMFVALVSFAFNRQSNGEKDIMYSKQRNEVEFSITFRTKSVTNLQVKSLLYMVSLHPAVKRSARAQ